MFTPYPIKFTVRPNTFTAQDDGINTYAGLDHFSNRIIFSKHSDTTVQLLGNFISSDTSNYDVFPPDDHNPYSTIRV